MILAFYYCLYVKERKNKSMLVGPIFVLYLTELMAWGLYLTLNITFIVLRRTVSGI